MKIEFSQLVSHLVEAFGQTIWAVLITLVIAGFAGLVIGMTLFVTRPGGLLSNRVVYTLVNVLVNIVRPIPFIILVFVLGPVTRAVIGTTIGTSAAVFVMCVGATFGISRIVEQNLVATDPGVIEAAKAMGAGPFTIIRTVIIPEALGPLILGYTFVFVAVVDMNAMVGVIGGGGLGDFALQYGYQRFDYVVTLVTVVVIIVLVQAAQFLGNFLARKALRR